MTREEVNEMERFAAILTSRLEDITDKYEDIYDRLKLLGDARLSNVCRVIDKIQEKYNELDDKITDLSEAVEEFIKAVRKTREETQQCHEKK